MHDILVTEALDGTTPLSVATQSGSLEDAPGLGL